MKATLLVQPDEMNEELLDVIRTLFKDKSVKINIEDMEVNFEEDDELIKTINEKELGNESIVIRIEE